MKRQPMTQRLTLIAIPRRLPLPNVTMMILRRCNTNLAMSTVEGLELEY